MIELLAVLAGVAAGSLSSSPKFDDDLGMGVLKGSDAYSKWLENLWDLADEAVLQVAWQEFDGWRMQLAQRNLEKARSAHPDNPGRAAAVARHERHLVEIDRLRQIGARPPDFDAETAECAAEQWVWAWRVAMTMGPAWIHPTEAWMAEMFRMQENGELPPGWKWSPQGRMPYLKHPSHGIEIGWAQDSVSLPLASDYLSSVDVRYFAGRPLRTEEIQMLLWMRGHMQPERILTAKRLVETFERDPAYAEARLRSGALSDLVTALRMYVAAPRRVEIR